tara:strand:+ start:3679 stop:4080 length:402 start_codon:yes stop_codon:yes gene_type:complete
MSNIEHTMYTLPPENETPQTINSQNNSQMPMTDNMNIKMNDNDDIIKNNNEREITAVAKSTSTTRLTNEHEIINQLLPPLQKILETTNVLKQLTAKINAGILVILFLCLLFICDFCFRFGQWYANRAVGFKLR